MTTAIELIVSCSLSGHGLTSVLVLLELVKKFFQTAKNEFVSFYSEI